MNQIYLDNAATTPLDSDVIQTMIEVMSNHFGNPSSVHQTGAIARDIIENSRRTVASLLKAEPSEIFFTSGATESINTIIEGAVRNLNVKHIITSTLEHSALVATLENMQNIFKVEISLVNFDCQGHIDLAQLEQLVQSDITTLVCLMHVNNELGNILPIEAVSRICQQSGALFFSDTVQSVGKLPLDLSSLKIDFAIGSAHKFHGPKGIGFMYIRAGLHPSPLLLGGPQERNMRAGTENIVGIAGLSKALELAYQLLISNAEYLQNLKNHLITRLKNEIPDLVFNGDENGIYGILNIGLPKENHNKMVIFNLDVEGFAVSGGSACSSGVMNISHVIRALGKVDDFIPLRISLSRFNTLAEIDRFVEVLKKY